MKRLFRWFGFALLFVFLLGGMALGAAYYYKADILAAVNQELKKNVNGDINLGKITFSLWDEFPALTITIHDVYLRGVKYDQYKKDFFEAKKVYINVRLGPLFKKKIVVRSIQINDGSVFIFRTKSGDTNLDIFKMSKEKDTASVRDGNPMMVSFRNVQLENVRFSFQDSMKQKSIGFHAMDLRCQIVQTDSSGSFSLTGPLQFEGLMLNPANGSYLKDKTAFVQWNLGFTAADKRLIIHPSTLEFTKSKVNLSGSVELGAPGELDLTITSDVMDYEEGVSLLTQALQARLAKIKIEKPIRIATRIRGQLALATPPRVDIQFQFSNAHVIAYSIAAEKVTTEGLFTNHEDSSKLNDDHNSMIKLTSFEGAFQGLPTHLTASLHDLKEPTVDLSTSMDVPLADFKALVDTNTLKLFTGSFSSRVEYSGKLSEFLDSTKTRFTGKLRGSARVTGGAFQYVPSKHLYEKVNAAVSFDENHVSLQDVSFTINKNPVGLKGELVGFVPFYSLPENKGRVKLNVYSPSLDLAFILMKESPRKSGKVKPKASSKKEISELIDKLSEKLEFDLTLQLDRLSFQNMRGSNVRGKVLLTRDVLEGQNMTMHLADGDIAFSLRLANLQRPVYSLAVTSNVRHADIRKFFYSFDNFKLKTIRYENLEGKVDMYAVFRANVDETFAIYVPSVRSTVDFSIKNGRLLNFEPLQNMSNFLFKKRDFTNVQFGEIKSRFTIVGTEIDIRKMEIESSVLRLFVEGRYSLRNSTDLEVQVPLSNLKKRDKDYKPENVGVDSRVGPSVFLHVYDDEKGKTVIAYDPFKKHTMKARSKESTSKKAK